MKGMIVYLRLERYQRQWLEGALGSPVRFPARSFENALLLRLLQRAPEGAQVPTAAAEGEVAIVVPDCAWRKPEYYCYLSRRAKAAMVAAIDDLFRLALWSECAPLIGSRHLNAGLDDWCRRRGISVDAREAVRQKFYRMRRDYQQRGIILGKTYGPRLKKNL